MKRMYARLVLWLIRPALDAHRVEHATDVDAIADEVSWATRTKIVVGRPVYADAGVSTAVDTRYFETAIGAIGPGWRDSGCAGRMTK